jgi:hypothetical protein
MSEPCRLTRAARPAAAHAMRRAAASATREERTLEEIDPASHTKLRSPAVTVPATAGMLVRPFGLRENRSAGRKGETMEVNVVLSSEEIIRGLKHYRRIAKQDLLRSAEAENPDTFRCHAEARRDVYAHLSKLAETRSPREVVGEALRCYQELPFVTGTSSAEYTEVKGRENALENFFLMVGLEPKVRREVRSQRPALR